MERAQFRVSFLHHILAATLLLVGVNSTYAQDGTPAQRNACMPEVFRLCSNFIPDRAAIITCLESNKPKSLSRLPGRVFREIEILDHTFRDGVSPLATCPPDRKSGLTIATMSRGGRRNSLSIGLSVVCNGEGRSLTLPEAGPP